MPAPLAISMLAGAFALQTFVARSPGAPLPAADSAAVLRQAKSAQAEFERRRRASLPWSAGGGGGRCDVRVGRFCYWHDDGDYDGPEEPARIAEARERLLERLRDAASRLAGDEWIAGQRVRYLVEQGRPREGAEAATGCRAVSWWCGALEGFALHAANDFAASESAFSAALALMPEEERCRWTDISLLLEGRQRGRYQRLPCRERAAIERRFWALARPLHTLPANDLWTEHLSRVAMARLRREARLTHNLSWGDDLRELTVRYGWPTRWSREHSSGAVPTDIRVIGHEPSPSFDLLPSERAIDDPLSAVASDWTPDDRLANARYAPTYTRTFAALEHQTAFFRRGDSAIVVAAYDAGRDTVISGDSLEAALALLATPDWPDSVVIARRVGARTADVLSAKTRWAPVLISVEVVDSVRRGVARARFAARPPADVDSGGVASSDLLLLSSADSLPATLDEALPRARGSLRVRGDDPLGVFWEIYGAEDAGESLTYSLTVTPEDSRWLRRAAERLGVLDRRAPVRMRWDDPTTGPRPVISRALALDLSRLPRGRYRLELALESEGRTVGGATRMLEVR